MKSQAALHGNRSSLVLRTALAVLLTQSWALAQAGAPVPVAQQPAPTPSPPEATPAPAQRPTTGSAPAPDAVVPANGATPAAPVDAAPEGMAPATAPDLAVAPEESSVPTVSDESRAEQDAQDVAEDLSDEGGKVNIYGFTDFTYSQLLSSRESFNGSQFPYPSFYVGNFNVYLATDLGHKWRSLSEVRFTYLPDGVQNVSYDAYFQPTYSRTSTAYPDYTDYGRNVKVGGVIIERAWLEYAAHPLLTIRGGHFLTPYGIWNVEHGSTVIIGTTRPFIIGSEMFPNHQTGLEMYGTYAVDMTQVGYHVTVSNGRGPVDQYKDWDKNKALGWRLWVQEDTSFGTFVLGTSGYKGRYTDRYQTTNVDIATGAWTHGYPLNSEYKELSLAVDLKWTWKGAVFQGEAIMHDVAYENSTRPAALAFDAGPQGWNADTRQYGVYAIAGYRLPWFGIMPYFGGEYYHLGKVSFNPDAAALWGGLNIRPTDRVVLKIQGTHAFFPADWIGVKKAPPMDQLITQVAWSF